MGKIKLYMGMKPLEAAKQSIEAEVYPMVIDGLDQLDPKLFSGDVDPDAIIGYEYLSGYALSEETGRGHYVPTQHEASVIVMASGDEVPVMGITSSRREEGIPAFDTIYMLPNGQSLSLQECIEQIEEINKTPSLKN